MVNKSELNTYKYNLGILVVAGNNMFKRAKNAGKSFQAETERLVEIYSDYFPSECRILRTYAARIANNNSFTADEIHLIKYLVNIMDEDFYKKIKRPKIFISHCEKDITVVESFVDLLSHVGLTSDTLFCSSIPGYNIKQGSGDIYEYLRNEFSNNLFVIFMLSENYYNSAACLNEMGATWILKQKYQSILLPGFNFSQIQGAINPREISFKLDDKKNRNTALGELKDNIIRFLDIQEIDTSKWDYQRERFFSQIDTIHI